MSARYFVREESSMMGAMFAVYDGWHGTRCGEYKYFRGEAETLACRLNAASAVLAAAKGGAQ